MSTNSDESMITVPLGLRIIALDSTRSVYRCLDSSRGPRQQPRERDDLDGLRHAWRSRESYCGVGRVPLDAPQRFHIAQGRRSISDLDLPRSNRYALRLGERHRLLVAPVAIVVPCARTTSTIQRGRAPSPRRGAGTWRHRPRGLDDSAWRVCDRRAPRRRACTLV